VILLVQSYPGGNAAPKQGDWVLDHIQEELAFMRGADLRR
jgi:hypothetical protein